MSDPELGKIQIGSSSQQHAVETLVKEICTAMGVNFDDVEIKEVEYADRTNTTIKEILTHKGYVPPNAAYSKIILAYHAQVLAVSKDYKHSYDIITAGITGVNNDSLINMTITDILIFFSLFHHYKNKHEHTEQINVHSTKIKELKDYNALHTKSTDAKIVAQRTANDAQIKKLEADTKQLKKNKNEAIIGFLRILGDKSKILNQKFARHLHDNESFEIPSEEQHVVSENLVHTSVTNLGHPVADVTASVTSAAGIAAANVLGTLKTEAKQKVTADEYMNAQNLTVTRNEIIRFIDEAQNKEQINEILTSHKLEPLSNKYHKYMQSKYLKQGSSHSNSNIWEAKYLKYKQKYLNLKNNF